MKRSLVETLLGLLVVIIAVVFFMYGTDKAEVGSADGYRVVANFSNIGGLRAGDDVQISGVKVGAVEAVALDTDNFLAEVTLNIESGIELPTDTAARISSESLLGGLYLSLEPGADDEVIEDGGQIEYTQAPQNLEQLLGQFIFSMQDNKEN
jgi:phospholipid/cholesterol/gamma-HCH transport system substrate-binding protein